MATRKRKRVSKKSKKSWRKTANLDDVENFLDDRRFEERTGHKVSDLPDDDLFQIDKVGETEKKSDIISPATLPKKKTDSLRLSETKNAVCFKIFENKSAVEDPVIKRNRVKIRGGKRQSLKEAKYLENGILTPKEKLARENRRRAKLLRKKRKKKGEFNFELWGKDNEKEIDKYSDWLTKDTVRHTLYNTGEHVKRIPKSIILKPSLLPAVEAPHPGISYNPSLKDHTDILNIVAENEKKVINEEKHIKRVTTDMFSKIRRNDAEKEWLQEMSAGLDDAKDEEEESINGDYTAVNPPVKNKKKTLKKRRKLREAAMLKEKLRQIKIEKKKISDIYKLKKFNASIKKKEAELKRLREKREKLKNLKPFQTKKLSHIKYEEPLMEFNTIDELTGNLRGIRTNSNLLLDRFKSLQKRNILEPRMRHFPKKVKRKHYERESTKMGWEPKGC